MSARLPLRFATYPGDARDAIGQIVGPNMLRERLTVVTADFDAETKTTRLGFAFTTTPDVEAQRDRQLAQLKHLLAAAELHRAFFRQAVAS